MRGDGAEKASIAKVPLFVMRLAVLLRASHETHSPPAGGLQAW
jgi:hypothetical protein